MRPQAVVARLGARIERRPQSHANRCRGRGPLASGTQSAGALSCARRQLTERRTVHTTRQPATSPELAKLEARIAELQAQARLLRDEIAGDATFRELLDHVDPHNDAKERHAQHIGRNLRRLREERELSQRELGMLLGYASGQRISYWELGRKAPGPRSLERLACVLEVHWTDFYALHAEE